MGLLERCRQLPKLHLSLHKAPENMTFVSHSSWGCSSSSFLRHPPLDDPACPLFKIFVSPLLFSVRPLLRYFRQFPSPHANLSPNPTNKRVTLSVQLSLSLRIEWPFFIKLCDRNFSFQMHITTLQKVK